MDLNAGATSNRKRLQQQEELMSSSSSGSSGNALLNPPPLRSSKRGHRKSREGSVNSSGGSNGKKSSSSSDGGSDAEAELKLRQQSVTRSGRNTAAFPGRWEYEWHEPSFFNHLPAGRRSHGLPPAAESTICKAGTDSTVAAADTVQAVGVKSRLSHQTLTISKMKMKIDRYVMMEVAAGVHQLVEVTATELMQRVKMHRWAGESAAMRTLSSFGGAPERLSQGTAKQSIGELTFRDIRQVFTEGLANPSIEVRRNCILVCLPPVTALLLHDRCVFLVNDELDTDSLIVRLEDLSGVYAQRADATREYYSRKAPAAESMALPSYRSFKQAAPILETPLTADVATSRLLFGDDAPSEESLGDAEGKIPRFVSFPLEHAMLEVLMSTAFEILQRDLEQMEDTRDKVERRVTKNSPSATRLEVLHQIKTPCQLYSDKVTALAAAFKDLLNNPEDMTHMELTKLFYKPALYLEQIDEPSPNVNLEILLEFFDQEINQFSRRVQNLLRSIDNAEKLLTLRMMLTRNSLVYYELAGTVLTTFLNVGTCISGIFGMNLINGGEDSHFAFLLTTSFITAVCITGIVVVSWMISSNKM